LHETVYDAAERIKQLRVQGARNVAIAAIKAIEEGAKESTARKKDEFMKELSDAKTVLFASRETEPLMRNAIRHVIHAVENSDETSVRGKDCFGRL
jgi:translation initiation factor 2B subunit (eIF-2B alpha/beta/delta family)